MNEKSFGSVGLVAFWSGILMTNLFWGMIRKEKQWHSSCRIYIWDPPFRLLLNHSDRLIHTWNPLFLGTATWFGVAPPPYELNRAGLGSGQGRVKGFRMETLLSVASPDKHVEKTRMHWSESFFVIFKSGFGPSCLSLAVFHVNSFVILCILVLCSVKAVCFSPLHLES